MDKIDQRPLFFDIFKLMLPLLVLLFAHAAANAQNYTTEEQDCFTLVQGRVAYDKLGNKTWSESNIRNLCRGTTNPIETISCFRDKIAAGTAWNEAIPACSPSALKPTPSGLSGNWAMYDGNGLPYEKDAVITQTGSSVTLNNGYGSEETVGLDGFKLNVRTWKLTGTIKSDGSRIDWSNGFYWVKKQYTRTEVQNSVDDRTLTLRNTGAINATINLYRADRKVFDNTPVKSIKWVDGGASPSVTFGTAIQPGTQLEVEITMKVGGLGGFWDLLIYRATIAANSSNLCFEVGGTAYKPTAKPCAITQAVEADYVTFRNEVGFLSYMKLDYTQITSDTDTAKKAIRTDDTVLGMERKVYRPRDAANGAMTLTINGVTADEPKLKEIRLGVGDLFSGCYKVWGSAITPKVSPCSISSSARTIKFWNNSGTTAKLVAIYDQNKKVSTNDIEVTQTESIEIPIGVSKSPVSVEIWAYGIDRTRRLVTTMTASGSFTGELCYKIEGTSISPNASTCDDVVGDTSVETRLIRFQNEAGYDAQMIVTYFVDEVIGGQKIPMAKTVSTGMINGLGGKLRLLAIPKVVSQGMQITIAIQGSTTVKNDIWSTTLPGNFADNPQPCFKVWGTLFDPQGGKCAP